MAAHTLRIAAQVENLATIRDFVAEHALAMGVPQKVLDPVILATDEAATNIIMHGYKGQPGEIEMNVSCEKRELRIRLRDTAQKFDPNTLPTPDLTLSLEERPIGGMGVYLMRRCTDEIHYRPLPAGGNELTLIKFF
jgi:serine/threonine-protein kinase RsbW